MNSHISMVLVSRDISYRISKNQGILSRLRYSTFKGINDTYLSLLAELSAQMPQIKIAQWTLMTYNIGPLYCILVPSVRVRKFETQEVVRHGSCPIRTLSDKTQPNDIRNCRTVSLSNTFRVEHFPPSRKLSRMTFWIFCLSGKWEIGVRSDIQASGLARRLALPSSEWPHPCYGMNGIKNGTFSLPKGNFKCSLLSVLLLR